MEWSTVTTIPSRKSKSMNRPLSSSLWLLLSAAVLVVALLPFDGMISQAAQALPGGVVAFNQRITDFGTFSWMIYGSGSIVIIAYILHRVSRSDGLFSKAKTGWRLALYFLVTIGSASIVVHLAKLVIGRARGLSSSPTMAPIVSRFSPAMTGCSRAFHPAIRRPSARSSAPFPCWRRGFRIVFALGALAIGISRVIVGAHYPSDVAAGLLVGLWTALMTAFLFARQNWLFRLDETGWPRTKGVARLQRLRLSHICQTGVIPV